MATKKRIVHCSRGVHCPHERQKKFSDWIRENGPDSSAEFYTYDIDFVLWSPNRKTLLIIEQKTKNAHVMEFQKKMLFMLRKWIKKGVSHDWQFLDIHLLTFENYCFDDGEAYWDNELIDEEWFIDYLYENFFPTKKPNENK